MYPNITSQILLTYESAFDTKGTVHKQKSYWNGFSRFSKILVAYTLSMLVRILNLEFQIAKLPLGTDIMDISMESQRIINILGISKVKTTLFLHRQ